MKPTVRAAFPGPGPLGTGAFARGWAGALRLVPAPVLALLGDPARLRLLVEAQRYALVSVLALGIDFGTYAALLGQDAAPLVAGAVGYLAGGVLHYVVSGLWVFRDADPPPHRVRLALFAASCGLGLAVTAGTIAALTGLGLGPAAAKAGAAVLSFGIVYFARRRLVFGARG